MRLASLLATVCFSVVLPCSAAVTSACADPGLRLNEILAGPATDWDGSGAFSSRDDEWIELVNPTAGTIALDGYLVTDLDSLPRYALSGSLPAGGHLLVTGRMSYDWERANGFPSFGLSLGNSGDAVILWRISGADTAEVERYAFRSHEAAADRAIGRSPDGHGDWVLLDALNPYTGTLTPAGTGCAPSPGAANQCNVTPARRVTWGQVKAVYR